MKLKILKILKLVNQKIYKLKIYKFILKLISNMSEENEKIKEENEKIKDYLQMTK